MAPGLDRTYAAEAWPRLPAALWEAARQQAREAARPDLPARIIGTDVDEGVLGLARFHAEKAGVAADIHFQQRTFAELSSKRPYGCVICNPPYGERLGRIGGGPGPAPRHARHLPPLEDLVVLHPHRPARLRGGHRPIGHAAAETVQRADRMHVLPVPGTETGGRAVERGAGSREKERGKKRSRESGDGNRRRGSSSASVRILLRSRSIPLLLRSPGSPSPLLPFSPAPRSLLPRPVFGGLSAKAREQAEIFRRD